MTYETISIIVTILLMGAVMYLVYLLVKSHIKIKKLKEELNKQDLDYHLQKIEASGYEYTIKSGKSGKKDHSENKKTESSKKTPKKSRKSKTFSDLLPKK